MAIKLSELFHKCAYEINYSQAGDSVNYAFVSKGKTLYIYFEGSNSITDWVRNFLFKKKPYKDMGISYKVHRGFLAAWKEVEDIIIGKITETKVDKVFDKEKQKYKLVKKFKWKHIIIVGYSHGGALAAFCHECVWFHRPDLREFGLEGYGFEAPRIYAGFRVKKELRDRWRTFTVVRTNKDIVTHCPPAIFGYTHVGNLLQVHGNINLVENKSPKCVKSHYPEVVYDALLKYEGE